jgi:transcription initiation factor TFIID subunit TAF12
MLACMPLPVTCHLLVGRGCAACISVAVGFTALLLLLIVLLLSQAEAGSVIGELEAQSKEQQAADRAVDAKEQQQQQQQQQHADSQQKAHPHAVLPDSEVEADSWVKVQADPAKDTETAAALAAAEKPEEVQKMLAELEAAIAAAEAAAAAGLQA